MLIDCPNCESQYDLDVAELSAAGFIRCARCRTMWTPEALGAVSAPVGSAGRYVPPVVLDTDRAARSSRASDIIDAEILYEEIVRKPEPEFDSWSLRGTSLDPVPEVFKPEPPDGDEPRTLDELENVARALIPFSGDAPPETLPVVYGAPAPQLIEPSPLRLIAMEKTAAPQSVRARWPYAAAALAAALAALFVWRADVVRAAPQAASFYATIGIPVNVRGLAFADVQTSQEVQDGRNVLIVTGSIANGTKASADIPRLRLALLDGSGSEVFAWAAVPAKSSIAPGETLAFRSRVASPPTTAQDVQVRFFNRRDLPLSP
jgi:predicted Zn finger-like uncharacterized protein